MSNSLEKSLSTIATPADGLPHEKTSMSNHSIVSFGEVLWDLLPDGKIAGGAPLNVAFHARTFGLKAGLISKVGADNLGQEMLSFLIGKSIPVDLIQTDHTFSTGTVNVTIDPTGSPSYEIVKSVAWDYIHPTEEAKETVRLADALIFGSLACRTDRTMNTLLELLDLSPMRVFDVNLRAPFFSRPLIEELLTKANLVKMNDEELYLIAGWHDVSGSDADKINFVKKYYRLEALLVTLGAKGAIFQNNRGLFSQTGFPVKVQDTIGSGDAFLGAFLSKALAGDSIEESLATACAAGAFVATQKGATTTYFPTDIVQNFVLA